MLTISLSPFFFFLFINEPPRCFPLLRSLPPFFWSFLFLSSVFFPSFLLSFPHAYTRTGQAESGKSTILRNFQLQYAPTAFHAEAAAWRAVIDLNLVRSVNFLLNLLEESSPGPSSSGGVGGSSSNINNNNNNSGGSSSADMRPLSPSSTKLMPLQQLTDDLRRLRMSLSPLRSIEESLTCFISPDYPRQIGVGARARGGSGSGSGDSDGDGSGSSSSGNTSPAALLTERAFEVSVRSGSRWKTLFKGKDGSNVASKASTQGMEELKNARRVIEACREDMVALWNHPAVRASLAEQKVSLEFQSGLCVATSSLNLPSPCPL